MFLCLLPLFYTGGLNAFFYPVFQADGTVAIMRALDAGEALRLIGDPAMGIRHVFGVPTNYQFVGQHLRFVETDVTRLAFAGVGGALTPDVILRQWQQRRALLQRGYGMKETSPLVLVLVLDKEDAVGKVGSAGKPMPNMQTRVVGDYGSDAPPDTIGELRVKGPTITKGYWRQPEAAAFTDGRLHTGDAALVDDEGYYFIVDRWKDMFISGGENGYPAEVENVLYQNDAIAETAVIRIPDPRWGQVGRAVVVVKTGSVLTEDDVVAHCAANLARYKLPQSVVFTQALPCNATGKVHKPTLRKTLFEG